MIKKLFCLMVIGVLLFTVDGIGQNTWVKTFGGSSDDYGSSIVTTTDGGYVLTGWTESYNGDFSEKDFSGRNVFVIKLNSSGDIVWKKTFGGSSGDWGYSITTTNDGGYVLTGTTNSNDGDFSGMNKGIEDILVVKLNSTGEIVWKKSFGGSDLDWGKSITTTSDGGYVLTGETYSNDGDFSGMNKGSSDIFVIKLNSSGETVWKKTYGGSSNDWGYSITTTSDGGYILTGWTYSSDGDFSGMNKRSYDIFVIKLNSSGDTVWKKTYGGSDDDDRRILDDWGWSITTTNDGGYVLTGVTGSNNGDYSGKSIGFGDIFVIKLNSSGKTVWKKTYGGSGGDYGHSITTTDDGGYVLTGNTYSNDGDFRGKNKGGSGIFNSDIFIMKLNSSGETVWKKIFGGISNDYGHSITTTDDGGYVLTGWTSSNDGDFNGMSKVGFDIFVMKLDKNGNLKKK